MVAKVTTNLREAILGSVTMNSLEHKGLHVIESVAHYTRYGIADVHTHTHTHTHTHWYPTLSSRNKNKEVSASCVSC